MERLTERKSIVPQKDNDGTEHKTDYIEIKNKGAAEEKLCLLEDLEEKLEMPLDKFARIFMEGIWTKKFGYIRPHEIKIVYNEGSTFTQKICRIETYVPNEWWQCFYLKDYGDTWCLSTEHEEPKKDTKPFPTEINAKIGGI